MFLLHLKDFNVLMDVVDLTDLVDLMDFDDVKDFRALPLFLDYQVVARLYLLCNPGHNHVHDLRSKSSMYGSPHQRLCSTPLGYK